jgi:hypothetical protein
MTWSRTFKNGLKCKGLSVNFKEKERLAIAALRSRRGSWKRVRMDILLHLAQSDLYCRIHQYAVFAICWRFFVTVEWNLKLGC